MTEEFDESWGTATRGVRAGTHRTPESEHSNAIYMTSSFVFEVTGGSEKIDKFIELMREVGLIEVARTGVVAIARGKQAG